MRALPKTDSSDHRIRVTNVLAFSLLLLCFLQPYEMASLGFLPSFTLYFVICSPELGERKA